MEEMEELKLTLEFHASVTGKIRCPWTNMDAREKSRVRADGGTPTGVHPSGGPTSGDSLGPTSGDSLGPTTGDSLARASQRCYGRPGGRFAIPGRIFVILRGGVRREANTEV